MKRPSELQLFAEAVDRMLSVPDAIESFGDNKFFISSLYDEEFSGEMSLEEFKRLLLEAHRAGLVVLARADMVQAMSRELVRRSEINDPNGADYHFVRKPETHAAIRRATFEETPMATKKKISKKKAAPEIDQHAADELVMFIENTSDLSPKGPSGQGRSVLLNALRRWKKGTYNPELAVKLFGYLVESGAKRYAKEFGSGEPWSLMFPTAVRAEAARQLEASFRNSVENGEYEHVDTRIGVREVRSVRSGRDQNAYGLTFAEWLSAAGGIINGRDPSSLRSAWRAGEDPSDYRAKSVARPRRTFGGARGLREASRDRPISMTYGQLPLFGKFEHDVHTRIDPERDGKPYWPEGTLYTMELTTPQEIQLAEDFGLDSFTTERRRTGRNTGAHGFQGDERQIYDFLKYLAEEFEGNGNEEAGDLASGIMTTLGYDWF